MPFTDQVVLVTGASRGIGRAIAHEMGEKGATVIGTATTEAGAEKISADYASSNIKGHGMVLDVSNSDSVSEVISFIGKEFSAPQILVNNAGITRDNLLMRMNDEQWAEVINTNLSSIYRMSKACIRGMMKAKYGRIINIVSVVGLSGNAGQTNYAAAKAGVIGFSKSLAREVGTRGITVNTVAPGFIETDMTKALDDDQRKGLLANVPMNRMGTPEDVSHCVTFLASPAASYITGETVHVNGGMYMN